MRKIGLAFIISLLSLQMAGQEALFKSGTKPTLEVHQQRQGIRLHNKLGKVHMRPGQTPAGKMASLLVPGYVTTQSRKGHPAVPVKTRLLKIPADAQVKLRIKRGAAFTRKLPGGMRLRPAQPSVHKSADPDTIPFYKHDSLYARNAFLQEAGAELQVVGIMRKVKLVRLVIRPMAYNPGANRLKMFPDMQVQLTYNRSFKPGAGYRGRMQQMGTTAQNKGGEPAYGAPRYAIVADPAFKEPLQPFVQWKTSQGFDVIQAYLGQNGVGDTRESIKAYLQQLYDEATAANPAPKYLLLVGDIDQVPAFAGETGGHVTDLYYTTFDGEDDFLPDMYYGRLPAQNKEQARVMIDKTLTYEKLALPGSSYMQRSVLVAGVDAGYAPTHGNGQINYLAEQYAHEGQDMEAETFKYPESGEQREVILDEVDQGAGLVNYTAHCNEGGWLDPGFSRKDVEQLQPGRRYGLMIGNCCLSARFSINTSFGEALVRAPEKGAVGYIGGTDYTYWDEDFWWSVGATEISAEPVYDEHLGMYDKVFHTHGEAPELWTPAQGQMVVGGNLAVTESGSDLERYYWEVYHLLGDPALQVWLGKPEALTATHKTELVPATDSLRVQTAAQARVALSQNGQLLATAFTDNSGTGVLHFPAFNQVGTATLHITRQHKAPYRANINIIPSDAPYLVADSLALRQTNGERVANAAFGDTLTLDLRIRNIAPDHAARNSRVKLRYKGDYIELLDTVQAIGTLGAADTADLQQDFRVKVADTVPDGAAIDYTVFMQGEDSNGAAYSWTSRLGHHVAAPELQLKALRIEDQQTGNGNGVLDPGESAAIIIEFTNAGHAAMPAAGLDFAYSNTYWQLADATDSLPTLEIGESRKIRLHATARDTTPKGTSVSLHVAARGLEHHFPPASIRRDLVIGFVPDYCRSAAKDPADTRIERVQIGDVEQVSGDSCAAYTNYTDVEVKARLGQFVNIRVDVGSCNAQYPKALRAYVDWNYDGDFLDNGEIVLQSEVVEGNATISGRFQVPPDARLGKKRLRLVAVETNAVRTIVPCGTYDYGETEAYTLHLTPPEAPVAGMEVTQTAITAGMQVQAKDTSLHYPARRKWYVTPGEAGKHYSFTSFNGRFARQPHIRFDSTGTYNVHLRVENFTGTDSTARMQALQVDPVTGPPEPAFGLSAQTLFTGDTLYITDSTAMTPEQWHWQILPQNGKRYTYVRNTDSASRHPVVRFNRPGTYAISLWAKNSNGISDTLTRQVTVEGRYLMTGGSATTCSGTFYDSGGAEADYSVNENKQFTLHPAVEGAQMRVDFTRFDVEGNNSLCFDALHVYDGPDTGAPLIGSYCGNDTLPQITASGQSGSLTFAFQSDGGVEKSGWQARVGCKSRPKLRLQLISADSALPNVQAILPGLTAQTDSMGQVVFYLEPGSYPLVLKREGFATRRDTIQIRADTLVEYKLLPLYKADFRILAGNNPVGASLMYIADTTLQADEKGRMALTLPAGSYPLQIKADDFYALKDTLQLDSSIMRTYTLTPTGSRQQQKTKLKVYPNPAQNQLIIQVQGMAGYRLFNATGVQLKAGKMYHKKILPLQDVKSGLYLLQVVQNHQVSERRIIVR